MIDRTYLPSGFRLKMEDGREFVIDKPIGQGGTALTYMGKELIKNQESVRVLLKELYPRAKGIIRSTEGTVMGNNLQAKILLKDMEEFLLIEQEIGNQIAKQEVQGVYPMTSVVTDTVTGNKFGLFYQCPPSMSLKQFVDKYSSKLSLRGKLLLLRSLGQIVQGIHEKAGFAHRDISAGNVLIVSGAFPEPEDPLVDWGVFETSLQVGIIDFACAFPIIDVGEIDIYPNVDGMQFHTEGYSAPELYEAGAEVTETADIYSVCACLWLLLTGKIPKTFDGSAMIDYEEWDFLTHRVEAHELYALSGDVRAMLGRNPESISWDVSHELIKILKRGLDKKEDRFGSMEILMERLSKVLALVEGSSVSQEKMATRAWKAYETRKLELGSDFRIREHLLPLATDQIETKPLTEFYENGESIFTIGVGGSGKTTSMFHLIERWKAAGISVIPIYLELNKIRTWKTKAEYSARELWIGADNRPSFVEQYMAGIYYRCAGAMAGRDDVMVEAMKCQIERKERDGYRYLILMDGLNEMTFSSHEERGAFLEALNWYLRYARNAQIILTSRYNDAFIESKYIRRIQVCGIAEESVQKHLEEELENGRLTQKEYDRLPQLDHTDNLKKCLKLPLFLLMYGKIRNKERVSSAGEILNHYFHKNYESVDGTKDYTERMLGEEKYRSRLFMSGISMGLARRITVDFIMPEIGLEMAVQKRFFADRELMLQVIERCQKDTWSTFVANWYSYQVDIEEARQALLKVEPERILEELCMNLGIMGRSGGNGFYFLHQYYRDYFAAVGILNRWISGLDGNQSCDFIIENKWSESVLQLCGEILGIHRTVPVQIDGKWMQTGGWDPIFDAMLDSCRHKSRTVHYELTKYIIEMIRLTRLYKGRPDFSGIDLSNINLLGIDVHEFIFSHPAKEYGIYAKLKGTGLGTRAYSHSMRNRTFHELDKREEAEEERSTIISPDGLWLLKAITNGTSTYLEEESVFDGESRELGVWGRCLQPKYSSDGKWIGFISSENQEVVCLDTVCFYNRETGETRSKRISQPIIDSCKFAWYGKQFVLLQFYIDSLFLMKFQIHESGDIQTEVHKILHNMGKWAYGSIGIDGQSVLVGNWEKTLWINQDQTTRVLPIRNSKTFASDFQSGQIYVATFEGELYTVDQQGTVVLCGKTDLLAHVHEMQMENGRLFLWIDHVLCEWNFESKTLRAIQWGIYDIWEQAFTIAGDYGVWRDGTIFRLTDGKTVKVVNKDTKASKRVEPKNVQYSITSSDQGIQLNLLDMSNKILYIFRSDEDGAMECVDYKFFEETNVSLEEFGLSQQESYPQILSVEYEIPYFGDYIYISFYGTDKAASRIQKVRKRDWWRKTPLKFLEAITPEGDIKQRYGRKNKEDIQLCIDYNDGIVWYEDGLLVIRGLQVIRWRFKKRDIDIVYPKKIPHLLTVGCEMDEE